MFVWITDSILFIIPFFIGIYDQIYFIVIYTLYQKVDIKYTFYTITRANLVGGSRSHIGSTTDLYVTCMLSVQ